MQSSLMLTIKNVKVSMWQEGDRFFLKFPFNRGMIDLIKSLSNPRWHGFDDSNPRKVWSIANDRHNRFVLSYLAKEYPNPYQKYMDFKKGVDEGRTFDLDGVRSELYDHQRLMVAHGLNVGQGIWAAEMGTGKTLAAIQLMEFGKRHFGINDAEIWYVAPKTTLNNIRYELRKWKSDVKPFFTTYESLSKVVKGWQGGKAPRMLIGDESTKVKTFNAQRSQAFFHVAEAMRDDWGNEMFIILMTGTPAPKSPVDWWNQCEIVCPGYIKEGSPAKFQNRISLVRMEESLQGSAFPKVVTYFDDERKCAECGDFEDHPVHKMDHAFQPSKNEVHRFYNLLNLGLVQFVHKKDCIDLPDKVYREVVVEPTAETKRLLDLVMKTSTKAVIALALSRELSDGFQYREEVCKDSFTNCPRCAGTGWDHYYEAQQEEDLYSQYGDEFDLETALELQPGTLPPTEEKIQGQRVTCPNCTGSGKVPKKIRTVYEVACPKDDALKDLLKELDDVGRVVIYAGFQASVDRVSKVCASEGWDVIKVDGRGWKYYGSKELSEAELIPEFQEGDTPKLAFVAQPGAGGYGFTLTASPAIIYYSNSFNSEHRVQSEDRIHRIGMDVNRGATIIDIVHLDTDRVVLENIRKKRKLEKLTMGQLAQELETVV